MGANVKKLIKKCPFLLLLVSTGILFSLIGLCGRKNIYAGQEYHPLKEPASAMMFKALKDDIYPWQIFEGESAPVMASGNGDGPGSEDDSNSGDESAEELIAEGEETENQGGEKTGEETKSEETKSEETDDAGSEDTEEKDPAQTSQEFSDEPDSETSPEPSAKPDSETGPEPSAGPQTENTQSPLPKERIEPLRESTREENLNHISADIYGDAGVKRAAEYEFSQVDESYFDDALFIGDSRTVGLRDYTDLSEHADFYCETSLTIQKIMEENFPGLGTVEEALSNKEYGKIYIMLGINELGVGTTEDFIEKYSEVIDFLHETEPEAKIFIQGIMRVTGKKHNSDAIFNNNNINARNNAIATLADNEQIFYIDVNEVVCDEEGNLNTEYTYDQLHLLGMYNDLWKQFLLSHGVTQEE